jgi:hypothetical protein
VAGGAIDATTLSSSLSGPRAAPDWSRCEAAEVPLNWERGMDTFHELLRSTVLLCHVAPTGVNAGVWCDIRGERQE